MFKGYSAILTSQNVWISSNIITGQLYKKCAELTQPHLQGFSVVKPIFFWRKLITIDVMLQGAKKIIFTACPSGKLKLAVTSPDVISASPKSFLTSRIDFTVLLLFEFLRKNSLARRAS